MLLKKTQYPGYRDYPKPEVTNCFGPYRYRRMDAVQWRQARLSMIQQDYMGVRRAWGPKALSPSSHWDKLAMP